MITDILAARALLLNNSGNPSAVVCAQDALACLINARNDEPHPLEAHYDTNESSAQLWTRAANRWVERGASHVWGFGRPVGW